MNRKIACKVAALAMGSLMALEASATLVFDQGFESDTSGWNDFDSTVTRVTSGTNGVTSAGGSSHATLDNNANTNTGAYTFFGGSSSVWPNGFTTTQQIYLDPAWSSGTGFDWSVAASKNDGSHLRDFIFHVAKDTSTGSLLVAGSNNTNFAVREDLDTLNNYAVTQAGWYTFQHVFSDAGGQLAVDLNLLDAGGSSLFTETRTNPADQISTLVGGNRYGWFTFNDIDGLAIDNTRLETGTQVSQVPEPSSLALLGIGLIALVARRKKV